MNNIDRKSIGLDGKLLDVVTYDTYKKSKEIYNNTSTAVEYDGLVYPIRSSIDDRPGMYTEGCLNFFKDPPEEEKSKYIADEIKNPKYVNLGNSKSVQETMEKQSKIRRMSDDILTNPDNIYVPVISSKDTPLMKGLKEAVTAKEIDINKYKDRFGQESFANDKRILKGHDITLFMLNRFSKALDLKVTITLEDNNNGNVPNPMNKIIDIDLNGYEKN